MGPLIRIISRYGIGWLVGAGIISTDLGSLISADPDVQLAVEIAVGGIASAAVEGWYWLARRFGWRT